MRTICAALVAFFLGCVQSSEAGDWVARVDDQTLATDRLAELMVLGQPLPLTRDVALDLTKQWADLTAFSLRMAEGDSLLGDAVVADATWFEVEQATVDAYRLARLGSIAAAVDDRTIDSIYAAGELRMLAHIVKAVGPADSDQTKSQQRSATEQILQEILGGVPWYEAARKSDDVATREQSGSLGLVRRGQTVPEFEGVAFALRPGEVSPVTETRFGFDIIYRPGLDDVRPVYTNLVGQELIRLADSLYGAEILTRAAVSVPVGAATVARQVVAAPGAWLDSTQVIAIYERGEFAAAQFAPYLVRLSDATRAEMINASDREIGDFVRGLVLQNLLVAEAGAAGVEVSDSATAAIANSYRSTLRTLWASAGISPDSLARTGGDRRRVAARNVDRYLEAVVARRVELPELPPTLEARLLAQSSWVIDSASIDSALERATRLLAATEESR